MKKFIRNNDGELIEIDPPMTWRRALGVYGRIIGLILWVLFMIYWFFPWYLVYE